MGTRDEIAALPPESDLTRADSLAREIFSDVANKWALLIIEFLGIRTMRFGELRDAVGGISHKMLTQNLRTLERNGLVTRTVHPTIRHAWTTRSPRPATRSARWSTACATGPALPGHIESSRSRYDS